MDVTTLDETLTLTLEVHGYDELEALERAELLAAAAARVLPLRAAVGTELGEGNLVAFHGEAVSLRFLHALGVGRGWVPDGDSFEELAGLE